MINRTSFSFGDNITILLSKLDSPSSPQSENIKMGVRITGQ